MATSSARAPAVDVRRADERFHTRIGWLDSHHSFSFGRHYDPANTHHGLLLVSNDDIVRAGTGFRTHPHRDMEIVTWVLDGELEHKDSRWATRASSIPGLAQRMSAGTGIWHSEMNPRRDRDVHFVQMWVPPDTERIAPGYEQLDINAELDSRRARARSPPAAATTRRSRSARRARSSGAGGSKPGRDGRACPTRRSSTSSWPRRRPTSRAPGRWRRATPRASPAPARRADRRSRRGRRGPHLGDGTGSRRAPDARRPRRHGLVVGHLPHVAPEAATR